MAASADTWMLRSDCGKWRVRTGRSDWITVRSMWIPMKEMQRCCGFLRGVRTGESACSSIGTAAWLTAYSSEAGAAANGAMGTTIGVAGGKVKSARREKEKERG